MFDVAVGSRTEVWTDTEYTTNRAIPRVGKLEYDPYYKAFFRLVKNTSATALAAQIAAVATGTAKSAFTVTLAGATDSLQNFAGVRVPGATSMAQNEYGWLQVSGQATFLHSGGAASIADDGIQTSGTVAGKVEAHTDTALGALASFAIAEAAVTTLDADVKASIVRCVFGP